VVEFFPMPPRAGSGDSEAAGQWVRSHDIGALNQLGGCLMFSLSVDDFARLLVLPQPVWPSPVSSHPANQFASLPR